MAQQSIESYFVVKKRAAEDEINNPSKFPRLDLTKNGISNTTENDSNIDKDVNQSFNETKEEKISASEAVIDLQEHFVKPADTTAFTKKNNVSNIIKPPESTKSTSIARKELSLGDIRKRLANCPKLAEYRAKADHISKAYQQLKEAGEKKNLKEFKSIDVEIPPSPNKKPTFQIDQPATKETKVISQGRTLISPRKVVVSPIKSPSKISAYIKNGSLDTPSTSLPLPYHYRFLAELFRALETVVPMLHKRNEKITFAKVKPSVQEIVKRNFTEKHLAQMKKLVPDFYNYEVQKVKNFTASFQKDEYELVISPNLPNPIKIMNPTVLLERRRYFYDTLLKQVKKHHAEFILTLNPPMVIPDDKLTRWHPEFEIEKIPEVECAKLPEMPNSEKCSTAQDVLAKARELFKCNTKMQRALEKLAEAKSRGLTEEEKVVTGLKDEQENKATTSTQTSQTSRNDVTLINPALRNLPASLLEKVKAKQAAKALEAMTRTSDMDHKYVIYSRLPDLARTLRNIYVTERKNVLALNIVLSKLDSSFKSNVSATDLQRDIKVLMEQLPEWVKLHEIRNNSYLKLDKNADFNNIISKLESLAAKYRNN